MSKGFGHVLILFAIATGSWCDLPADEPDAKAAFAITSRRLQEFNDRHGRVFDGPRVPIHYLSWTEEGIPLVLLHGTYSTAHDFARFAPDLIAAGYRPISVDWYGHGQTPIPQEPVAARDFAHDLQQLLKSLKIERAVFAGHSRGGTLCSVFYDSFSDQVLGLVLIDGGSTCTAKYFSGLGEQGLTEWMSAAFDPKTGQSLAPSYETLEELFTAAWERFGRPEDPVEMFDILSQAGQTDDGNWTRSRDSLKHWLQQDTLDNTYQGMLNPQAAPRFFRSTVLFEPLEAFGSLAVPVLILDATGRDKQDRDPTPTHENQQLQQLHPTLIEHVQLPTGHFLHREAPDTFMDALIRFQKRISLAN